MAEFQVVKNQSICNGEKSLTNVLELSREEAIIAMVDSNLQRERILPSEKAFSYQMKYDAMKRKAGRPSRNSCQVGANLRTDEQIAKNTSDSARQIQRYQWDCK